MGRRLSTTAAGFVFALVFGSAGPLLLPCNVHAAPADNKGASKPKNSDKSEKAGKADGKAGESKRDAKGSRGKDDPKHDKSASRKALESTEAPAVRVSVSPRDELATHKAFSEGERDLFLRTSVRRSWTSPDPLSGSDSGVVDAFAELDPTDLGVRLNPKVRTYLEYFLRDPRGKNMLATWVRRNGRFGEAIRRTLGKRGMPLDLEWLAMIESGYDVQARSPVGAAGLWQFMPDTAKTYGLAVDRFVDQRLSPRVATTGAADFLAELHRKFGSWELAMAAYNMGSQGLLSILRKYNTNDFWQLAEYEGALPWETTLYVPKIAALAIAARNLSVFGLADASRDPAIDTDEINAPPGVSLALVAQAAGLSLRDIETLNPEFRLGRVSPTVTALRVPAGKGAATLELLRKLTQERGETFAVYTVKSGDTLKDVADRAHVPLHTIVDLNKFPSGTKSTEAPREGTVLLLPVGAHAAPAMADKPVAVLPLGSSDPIAPLVRAFHRCQGGETAQSLATRYGVRALDVVEWNTIDPTAKLQEGMLIQLHLTPDSLARAEADHSPSLLRTEEVRVVRAGSSEFLAMFELRGRRRVLIEAKTGDTLAKIASEHRLPATLLERINRKSRTDALAPGSQVILYLD
jgi:membrane-bound lytic murein transglycosylase D